MKPMSNYVWRQLERQEQKTNRMLFGNSLGYMQYKDVGSVSDADKAKLEQLKHKGR